MIRKIFDSFILKKKKPSNQTSEKITSKVRKNKIERKFCLNLSGIEKPHPTFANNHPIPSYIVVCIIVINSKSNQECDDLSQPLKKDDQTLLCLLLRKTLPSVDDNPNKQGCLKDEMQAQ